METFCKLIDYFHLDLLPTYKHILEHELDDWHEQYLPVKQGATVIDMGAGCGESAEFFLRHGAGFVVAIEAHPAALQYLQRNFGRDPRVLILGLKVEKIKIDIEGGEEDMVFETHFPMRFQKWPHTGLVMPPAVSENATWKIVKTHTRPISVP